MAVTEGGTELDQWWIKAVQLCPFINSIVSFFICLGVVGVRKLTPTYAGCWPSAKRTRISRLSASWNKRTHTH